MAESSGNESDSVIMSTRKRKKGVINKCLYKSEVIKKARLKGVEYTNSKGDIVTAREIGVNCGCKKQCFSKITEDEKIEIFIHFYDSFDTKDSQDIYLQSCIEAQNIQRHRPRNETPKARSQNFSYFVTVNGKRENVCKKAFIALYATTERRVRRLSSLKVEGKSPKDKRGKQPKGNAIPGAECDKIKTHIESFPVKISHYASKTVQYLDSRLDVKQMYELFHKKHPDSKVKYKFYLRYFKENFELRFGRPQVDTCSQCEELSTKLKSSYLNDNAKRAAAAELLVHKRRAKKFDTAISEAEKECREQEDVFGICFDFMQNLPLPHLPVQEVFYYRQLWVNVFCVHNLKDGTAKCYVYHEGIAKKGPNEVCSMLYDYILNDVPKNVRKLLVFSDGCGGQNRNHIMMRFWATLSGKGQFDLIRHCFPVRGHSYLPCDRDFGVIKRKIRHSDRVFSPQEYSDLILQASKSGRLSVHMLTTDSVLNFKDWWPEYYKKTPLSTDSLGKGVLKKVSLAISEYNMFEFQSSNAGEVVCYNFINGLVKYTFRLLKPHHKTVPCLPIVKAYLDPVKNPIHIKKHEDITKLMKYIPNEHSGFYREIMEWPTTTGATDDA